MEIQIEEYKVLKEQLKLLGLDAVSESFLPKAQTYRKSSMDYIDYLADLIALQVQRKSERSVRYRFRMAKFPCIKTYEEFDFAFQKNFEKEKYNSLLTFNFVKKAENILFLGPPGVGKTHLAIALGVKACELKIRTLFMQASELAEKLISAKLSKTLPVVLDQLSRYELLIIDELGYMPMSAELANLLFQLISRKYEYTSIIITSNKNFKDWGSIFNDDVIAAAIIDRLLHHSHLFKINGESYRIKNKILENNKESKE